MQDRVGFVRVLLELPDGLPRRQDQQFDLAALGFVFHPHPSPAMRSVPVPVPITSRRHFQGMASFGEIGGARRLPGIFWFFLALADLASINHYVMFVRGPVVDADRTEGELLEAQWAPPSILYACW